jgi:predicted MPP superfamily phosphohydrolase
LFAFRAAQLKAVDHESVKHLPDKITALTFAAAVAGNHDYNKEFQALEKKGILRHIRVANKGDVVPTNEIFFPASLAIRGNSKLYTQNGVNLFLLPDEELVVDYRNTKNCCSQFVLSVFGLKAVSNHLPPEYIRRVDLPVNKKFYQQTVEELYATAGNFTN